MAQKIRGVTVEIGGDTSGLQKSLKEVNSAISSTARQLKDVNNLLKLDPGNTELLKQKQTLLANEISEVKKKIEEEKAALAQMNEESGTDAATEGQMALQRDIIASEQKLKELEKEARECSSVIGTQFQLAGEKIAEIGDGISNAGEKMMPVTAAITATGAAAVKTAADFDSSMSQVAATMGYSTEELNDSTTEAAQNMQALSDFAKEMGASTAFSASEAADALNYMALAGYDAETSMKMLPTVLNLAAAGGIDLASASDMVTDAQSALGLTLEQTETMVDQMAKASSKSNTSVQQLGEAFLVVGGTAKNLAGGTTELSTALGILADNGVKGSEGGTALRNIILSLSAPTDTAAQKIEELGLQVFDAEGNMRSMGDIFSDLNMELESMSQGEKIQALNKIFNKTDLKSVNALLANTTYDLSEVGTTLSQCGVEWQKYSKIASDTNGDLSAQLQEWSTEMLWTNMESAEGIADMQEYLRTEYGLTAEDAKIAVESVSESIQGQENRWSELTGYVENAGGAAQNMADTQLNNLNGQITLLKSALEGLMISIGEIVMPYIRQLVDFIQKLVDKFNGLDEEQKKMIVAIAAIVAAVGPVLIIVGKVVTFIGTIVSSIGTIITVLTTVGTFLIGTLIPAIAGVVVALGPVLLVIAAVVATVIGVIAVIKNWGAISEWLSEKWTEAKDELAEIWGSMKEKASEIFTQIKEKITIIFTALFNAAPGWAKNLISGYINIIKAEIELVKKIFTDLKEKGVKQTFLDLISDAKTWASDMIQNFINGIKEKISAVGSAVKDVASTISSYLHFSLPEKGPLARSDTWMPDFMDMLAQTMQSSINILDPALNATASRIAELSSINVAANNTDLINYLSSALPGLGNQQIVLDTGALVGQTVGQYNAALGKLYTYDQRNV